MASTSDNAHRDCADAATLAPAKKQIQKMTLKKVKACPALDRDYTPDQVHLWSRPERSA